MEEWYAHSLTTTWDIDVSAARCHPHDAMGWTTFGRHVASLISPSTQVLRIDFDVREKLSRSALQCDYHQVCFWHLGERGHEAPVEPGEFTRDVTAKHFTNGADCYEVVVLRYKATFLAGDVPSHVH